MKVADYRVPSINMVHITGNLTGDPDLRYTPEGQPVCSFQIASNRRYKNRTTNEWQEITTFIRVVTWRQLAERLGETLRKGSAVYVEGRIQTRSWEDKDGNKKYMTEIVAQLINLLGRKGEPEEEVPEKVEEPLVEETKTEDEDLPF